MASSYLRNTDIALLVFSLDNRDSFESLATWHQMFRNETTATGYERPCVCLLFGNKSDLDSGAINAGDISKFVTENNITHYFRVSAKNQDVPVEQLLDQIVALADQHELAGLRLGKNRDAFRLIPAPSARSSSSSPLFSGSAASRSTCAKPG